MSSAGQAYIWRSEHHVTTPIIKSAMTYYVMFQAFDFVSKPDDLNEMKTYLFPAILAT